MRKYSDEEILLCENKIMNVTDLQAFTDTGCERLKDLRTERQKLRNKLRHLHDTDQMQPIKDEIHTLSKEIKKVSYSIELAKDIAERSEVILYVSATFEYEQECAKDKTYADRYEPPDYPYREMSEKWLKHREELDRKWTEDVERIEAERKAVEEAKKHPKKTVSKRKDYEL